MKMIGESRKHVIQSLSSITQRNSEIKSADRNVSDDAILVWLERKVVPL